MAAGIDIFARGMAKKTSEDLTKIAYSVEQFGAKGDGVTNDTQAIQETINKAQIDKKAVFFPAGVYGISSTLVVTNAIDIYGVGRYSVIKPLNDIPVGVSTSATKLNSEFGALMRIEYNETKDDGYYGIESPLDGVGLHDIYFKGDMRKYKCDAIQLFCIDHSRFYNLEIEEIKGSAFKFYAVRENFYNDINIRYCGLKHNVGEDEKRKGHPVLTVIQQEAGLDSTNLNVYSNIQIMCSFYTAIREIPDGNKFINVNCHQMFSTYLPTIVDPYMADLANLLTGGDLPKNDNGKYMDFDVIQVIRNGTWGHSVEFTQCGAVWGGQTRAMVYAENTTVYLNGGSYGGHWTDTSPYTTGNGIHQGIGVKAVNSKIFLNECDMSDNFHIAEKDSSDLSYIYVNNLGGLYGVDVDNTYLQSNANTILTQFLSNHTKSVNTNYRTDNYLGGHHYGDRYVMERGISANNTSKAYIIGNRTDVNGHFMYQIEGVLKLGDNFVDITSPWEGMIWKDPSGNVQVQTIPYGKVTAGETKAFTKGSVAPTSPQEGWVWYDTVNKKFKGWNGTAWAELG